MLTIAYITNRSNPRVEWFLWSLKHELVRTGMKDCRVLLIDFHLWEDADNIRALQFYLAIDSARLPCEVRHLPTAPSVWQGPHRLTKDNHFDAAAVRNGAVCYAEDGYLACVDDLSVMLPGWLDGVIEAMKVHYIACGAYKKVKDLVVEDGRVVSFTEHPAGNDARARLPHFHGIGRCPGNWMYGCSFAAPVEALLKINGWPAAWCAGMAYEDSVTGDALARHGYLFRYEPRMMTYESEELHHVEKPFRRDDYGVSPNDKSHALLRKCEGIKEFPNDFGGGFTKLADLRRHVLAGGSFPVPTEPKVEWFTGKRLEEL